MKRIIASVKLAPGSRGYFDPLTGINLSPSNNIGYVREGDNLANIRRAIKENKIRIVGGILPPAVSIKPVKVKLNKVVEEQPIIKEEIEIQPMEEEIKVDAVDKIKKKRQKKEEVIPAVNKEAKEKIQEVQAILEDMKDGE
jgi:hypothetical protein